MRDPTEMSVKEKGKDSFRTESVGDFRDSRKSLGGSLVR